MSAHSPSPFAFIYLYNLHVGEPLQKGPLDRCVGELCKNKIRGLTLVGPPNLCAKFRQDRSTLNFEVNLEVPLDALREVVD